jgi:hypothetical protein
VTVEFLVLTFPGASPGPGAVEPLSGVRRAGAVNVIDTPLVAKRGDSVISWRELAAVPDLAGMVRRELSDLLNHGVLTPEEFAQAKVKVLAG